MTVLRMDNVAVVVDDLAAATAFFIELGLELEGEAQVEGAVPDRPRWPAGSLRTPGRWSAPGWRRARPPR
ncbi:hypothetical protein ACH4NR_02910 [Streptomyces globisporus]|uniref:hypothetical protein n=1 Tax=Streptomyces globisporus TaxID=1908 RepID=UPI003792EE89